MSAGTQGLSFKRDAEDGKGLGLVRFMVENHLLRFAFRESLTKQE